MPNSPNFLTLADLVMQGGNAQAKALIDAADRRARGLREGGAIKAGLATNLANIGTSAVGAFIDERNTRLKADALAKQNAIENAQGQQKINIDAGHLTLDQQKAKLDQQKFDLDKKKADAEEFERNLTHQKDALTRLTNQAAYLRAHPGAFASVKQSVQSVSPEIAQQMGDAFDGPTIERLEAEGTKALSTLESQAFGIAAGKAANELAGPDAVKKYLEGVVNFVAADDNAKTYAQRLDIASHAAVPEGNKQALQQAIDMVRNAPQTMEGIRGLMLTSEQKAKLPIEKQNADTAALNAKTAAASAATRSAAGQVAANDPNVQALLDGSISERTFSTLNGKRAAMVAAARTVDPTFTPLRYDVRREFEDPGKKTSLNIRSLNTAISHVDKLSELADDLKNGNVQGVNSFVNWVRTSLGHSEVTNFEMAMGAVAGESANVFKNSGATDQEIDLWKGAMSKVESRTQIGDGLKILSGLFAGRMDAIQYEWHRVFGDDEYFPMLTPAARKALGKLGVDLSTLDPGKGESKSPTGPADFVFDLKTGALAPPKKGGGQ